MQVAVIQHDIVWEDPVANFARLAPMIAAAAADADLVVLTEMYSTGFSMDTGQIAEPPDGPSARFLADQSREHGAWVCGSVPEREEGSDRPANCLVLAGPGGEVHRYRKIHPFSFGSEHEHYTAGTERVTVTVEGVRLSLFVCYDLRFADEFWALADDTDAYLVVANWPAGRRDHWRILLRARAIENQAYVIAANRVGSGGGLEYAGDSMIVGPFGETVAFAGSGETTITGDVDRAVVEATRTRYPFLTDRRR
ncbi:MAG: nitrilase-related carbon-nitrogen hydrolase [Acidimicrobiia bacterium]